MPFDTAETINVTHEDNVPFYENGRLYKDKRGNLIGFGRFDDKRGAFVLDLTEATDVASACPWAAVATGQSLDVIDFVAAAAEREMDACGY